MFIENVCFQFVVAVYREPFQSAWIVESFVEFNFSRLFGALRSALWILSGIFDADQHDIDLIWFYHFSYTRIRFKIEIEF